MMRRQQLSLRDLQSYIADPHETPAGLIVPGRSMEPLIKAEADRLNREAKKNNSAFFSKVAMASNMISYGAREKPQGTPSFGILQEAARKSFIDAIIIRARVDQMKRTWQRVYSDKQIGFKVVHVRSADPTFKGSKEIDDRCREMEDLLANPTPLEHIHIYPHNVRPHDGIKDLIARLTRAELVIDRKVLRTYPRKDGKGVAAFHWLPGDTIKPVDEGVREWARNNEKDGKITVYSVERASYASGFDLTQAAYVQLIDGMITEAYTPEELSVHISNPSDELNRWGYGESRLELSLDITSTLIYAWRYNQEMFKTNYPEQVLAVIGDYDKDGLAAFKQQVLGENGPGSNWRLPVIPFSTKEEAELKSIKLRETPKDMLFDQMLRIAAMFKLASYGAHASVLNLGTDSGGGSAPLFGHNPSDEIEFSKELSFIPSLTDLCEWMTDCIIHPRYDDLMLIITGLNPEDEKLAEELRQQQVKSYRTRNEVRMQVGDEPVGDVNDPMNPWNYPADVPIPNYLNTFQMLQQAEEGDPEEEDMQKAIRNGMNDLRKAISTGNNALYDDAASRLDYLLRRYQPPSPATPKPPKRCGKWTPPTGEFNAMGEYDDRPATYSNGSRRYLRINVED